MVLDSNTERTTQKWGFLTHPKSDKIFSSPEISSAPFAAKQPHAPPPPRAVN